jgi:hypothetical protein
MQQKASFDTPKSHTRYFLAVVIVRLRAVALFGVCSRHLGMAAA